MRIGFWLTTPKQFDPAKIDETPFGGAEISAIQLAREMGDSHQVVVFGNSSSSVVARFRQDPTVSYASYEHLKHCDILDLLIVVRADQNLLNPRRNHYYFGENRPGKIILWTGDAYDQPNNQIFHDKYCLREIDHIVVKSDWQRESLLRHFPLLKPEKVSRIYNGLDVSLIPPVQEVKEPRFIYASTAYRGLHKFLSIWPLVKEAIPEATLDCYCKTTLYMEDNPRESQFQQLYRQIEALDGVRILDPLPQRELLARMPSYFAMLYPNDGFVESSCGVALQAMACGVRVITSKKAGLVETIQMGKGSLGSLVGEGNYDSEFVGYVLDWWNSRDSDLREMFRKQEAYILKETYSWSKVMENWSMLLEQLLGKQADTSNPGCPESLSASPVAAA